MWPFNPHCEPPSRRYSSVPFPVSEHVRPKGVRLLVQRHDVLRDALTEQQLVLPPPAGLLPGHQALRHVMPSRGQTSPQRTGGRCHRRWATQQGWTETSKITTERRLLKKKKRPRPHGERALLQVDRTTFSVLFHTATRRQATHKSNRIIIIYNNKKKTFSCHHHRPAG